jgi:hypothetical protein
MHELEHRGRPLLSSLAMAVGYNLAIMTALIAGLLLRLPLTALGFVWGFAIGAIVGSGVSLVRFRRRAGLGLNEPPSFCAACHATLAWRDKIPVASWLVLRGHCRFCNATIPARELAAEIFVGLACGSPAALLVHNLSS